MSILCDPKHPLFAQFPTEFYSNWQWYDLIQNSRSLILDDTPADFRPLVQVIDNFARNHKLGSVFEARVGKGKLLVCAIDLTSELADVPPPGSSPEASMPISASPHSTRNELEVAILDRILHDR